jgi:hypothetical protein
MKLSAHCWFTATFIGIAVAGSTTGVAEKKYAPGVTDTEIKVGQTMPYSRPASAWGTIGLAELAYIKMINDRGVHDVALPWLLPRITLNTNPTDHQPIKQFHESRFNGTSWELLDDQN